MANRLSFFTIIACAAVMFYSSFVFYPRWEKPATNAAIAWDVAGYYWYLPSVFIYKDLRRQEFKDCILNKYRPTNRDFQEAFLYQGNYVMKYSSGMAIMYLPFFAVAHAAAGPLGYPRDGFSAPYQFAIQFGGLIVALVGLWYFRKLLLKFYNDKVVAVCLLILVMGTNYLNYAAIDSGMPHAWLFTIYVFLILSTIRFYQNPGYRDAVIIGLLVGLATLTRPTDIISALIPLLWGLEGLSRSAIKKHLDFLYERDRFITVVAACAAAVFCIQIIYWKHTTGQWLVYSYENQSFSLLSPHFQKYMFSYATGWLVYTPMMFLAFLGLIPLFKYNRHKVAIITFFLVNLYIVCAWDAWFYGGRAMVQSYAILMFPIAALVDVMWKKRWLQWSLAPVILFFVYANVWATYNAHAGEGLFDEKTMTKEYFWRIAGRWHKPPLNVEKLKDTDELFEGEAKNMRLLYSNDYEDTTVYSNGVVLNGKRSLYIGPSSDHPSSGWEKFAYSPGKAKWIRLKANILSDGYETDAWSMREMIIRFTLHDSIIKERKIRVDRFGVSGKPNTATAVYFDTKVPDAAFDSVGISFWNPASSMGLVADDLSAWSFD